MDFFLDFQHFHFLRPGYILAFIMLVIILHFFSQREDSLAMWRKLMSKNILNSLTVKGSNYHRFSPQKLSFALAVVVTIILMGPTWKQQPSPFSQNNAALIIVLDVSTTMTQTDVQPSRLLRAKQKIIELLNLRGDTNTALIAFSGSAHTVMPITNDREMIRLFLDVLDPELMPIAGKLPQSSLPIIEQLLKPTKVPGTVLLLTDSANNQASQAFSDFFAKQPHQLIVWGFGKSQTDQDFDNASNIIPTQLAQLQNLAKHSHGKLITMSVDKSDINDVNRYIEHNLVVVDDKSRPWLDAGYGFVFLASLIFLFWFRKGWTLQW